MNMDIENAIVDAVNTYKESYVYRGLTFTHEDLVKTVITDLISKGVVVTMSDKELEIKQLRRDVWFSSDYVGNNKYQNVNEIVDFLYTGKLPDRFNT